jgi:integrase/recombinase XerD
MPVSAGTTPSKEQRMKRQWLNKVAEYLDVCEYQKKLDQKTLKAYRIDLRQFKDFFACQGGGISKRELSQYIIHLHQGYKPKSVKRKVAAVRAYFKFLEYEEYLPVNPFAKLYIKCKEPLRLPRTIPFNTIRSLLAVVYRELQTQEEKSRLYDLSIRDIAVLELLFATGMRVSELCALAPGDIDLNEGVIRIFGKGSKERIIQISNDEVIKTLGSYEGRYAPRIAATGSFFINSHGRRLNPPSVRAMLRKYTKDAAIALHITPHMFRHSFATLLLEEDVDIRYIQQLLGHSSIVSTQIYTHVSAEKQRLILSSKHPRNKLSLTQG